MKLIHNSEEKLSCILSNFCDTEVRRQHFSSFASAIQFTACFVFALVLGVYSAFCICQVEDNMCLCVSNMFLCVLLIL